MAEKTMPFYVKRDQQKNGEKRAHAKWKENVQICKCANVRM